MGFDLAKWVFDARSYAGLTQEELAHKVNLSGKANISAFEKGKTKPTFKTIWDIGEVCSYPLPQNQFNITNNNIRAEANGNHAPVTQNNVNGICNNNFSSEKKDNKTKMHGDSMYPVIPNGSDLELDSSDTYIQDGKTYLIEYGGLQAVRRLFAVAGGQIRIKAHHPDYPEETLPAAQVRIIGRIVRWCVHD